MNFIRFTSPASGLGLLSGMLVGGMAPAQEITSFTVQPPAGVTDGRLVARLQGSLTVGANYIIEDSSDLKIWNRVSPVFRPAAVSLDWRHLQSAPFAPWLEPLHNIAGSSWDTRRFYRVKTVPAADPMPSAIPTTPRGRLWRPTADGPFFLTTNANWRVTFVADIAGEDYNCTIDSPDSKASYQFWSYGIHENLNGKHLKDRFGDRRSIILPGNTMITFTNGRVNPGDANLTIQTISIYDADQTHRLNMYTNTVELSVLLARVGEASEADGETMRIWHVGNGRYYAENIYTETEPGSAVVQEAVPLGSTGGDANPNQVHDLIDDPRLPHT